MPGHDDKKSRIGFALLSLRSAKILPTSSNMAVPFMWQKLMGVSNDHRNFRPELFLSLTIRECSDDESVSNISLQETGADVDVSQHRVEENEHKVGLPICVGLWSSPVEGLPTTHTLPFLFQIIQLKYLSDGYVQIGEDTDCSQSFSLAIHLKSSINLDLLLPEVLVFKRNRDRYYMSFNIFGITIKSKTFSKDLHSNILLKEKLVVKILSSYQTLSEFLKNSCYVSTYFDEVGYGLLKK